MGGFLGKEGGKVETITLNEIISYSKGKENAPVTVIDDVTADDLDYVKTVTDRLRLYILAIVDTNMIAIINRTDIAVKIASDIHRKCQVMYYDYIKRPSANLVAYRLTGYTPNWIVLKDNGYIIKAYDEDSQEMAKWLDTDIETTSIPTLDGVSKYSVSISIRGVESNSRNNTTILELSRYHFLNDGTFNEERGCYYPNNIETPRGEADYNKLEKLFKRWGFNSL